LLYFMASAVYHGWLAAPVFSWSNHLAFMACQ
jgi:hypothetical protein